MGKLTATGIKGKDLKEPGTYVDGDGLMLVVKANKNGTKIRRSWMLRLMVDGKRRDFGLGSADDVSLADARDKADVMRKQAKAGIDPVVQKRAAKLARMTIPTFQKAAESTHGEQKDSWRNEKHQGDWLSSLRLYVFPALGDVRIDLIDAPMIRDVLLPIWLTKPETARRVRQRIRAVMGWAASNGYRSAIDMAVMDAGLPKQPKRDGHFAAMDWQDVPAFVAKVRAAPETVGRLALLFTLLAACRSGETRGAIWEEFDLEAAKWTIPANRMKANREHIIPLSAPALAILGRAKLLRKGNKGEPVFPGREHKPISDMTMTKVIRDAGRTESVHGFRSSFKDWASENTSFPDAVSEAALAHIDADKTRRAYRRTDFFKLRVDLMAAWAAYVDGAGAESNVVPIGAATKLAG
ncbi:MAG: integrase arm-type DNA-binding domain-containing protein [Alphaproteobacteria bacterium]|nr:integrase arm-type DNA-binding domain-containing protein [Alphaproteobacteria bacterium]